MEKSNMISFDEEKIFTDVATSLIENAIKSGWNKICKFFKDINAKESIDYGNAYTEYLQNMSNKVSKVKTLIYRHSPKSLYSFYECIDVFYENKIINTKTINNLFKINNNLIITGTGGIGKSMLLKHLFLNTITNTYYIPVLIELGQFNHYEQKDISLYNAIYQCLSNNGFNLKEEYYLYSLEQGGYVILLDGFDEIHREKKEKLSEEIKTFTDKFNKNRYIITSRPADNFIGWNNFYEMILSHLTKKQALSLINKIEFDPIVKDIFYKALNEHLFKKYTSFASNPLLLTIMLLTFNNHASIPEKLNDFYEEAFSTLFNRHDATKNCYVRDIRSNLGYEDFKTVFAYICFKSYFLSEFEFSDARLKEYIQMAKEKFSNLNFTVNNFQEDLISSVCMFIKDGLNYRFTHRSFQEYFAAWYTCKLTDDIQNQLITSWITESNTTVITDNYINMLFNLQPDKTNEIIFCPGIKLIKKLYDQKGFSANLLSCLFDKIYISTKTISENKNIISITIKNFYLFNIINITCTLNNYTRSTDDKFRYIVDDLAKKIVKECACKDCDQIEISFKDILSIINEKDLLQIFKGFNNQLQFCFDILDKYTNKSISKKRTVSSILAQL